MPQLPLVPGRHGPGVERSTTLTDAVVAIAMTLLVLPLVDAAGDVDVDHPARFLAERSNLLLSFVVSFLVIHLFWTVHATEYRRLTDADLDVEAVRPLTMWWLLVIAFLPFPTAVVGREATTFSVPLYVGTMAVASVLTSAISVVVARAVGAGSRGLAAWLNPAVFVVCTVIGLFDATVGLYSLLLLVAVRLVELVRRRGLRNRGGTSP